MPVSVEQALDLQYLLQLGQRPPVAVVPARIASVLLRQEIHILRKPFAAADIGAASTARFQPVLPIWNVNPAVSDSMWSPKRLARP